MWLAAALAGDELAGVATACLFFTIEAGGFAELQDLYVRPGNRNRGIARSLIESAAQWSLSKEAERLEVVITPEGQQQHDLDGFYVKQGFERTGRTILTRSLGGVVTEA